MKSKMTMVKSGIGGLFASRSSRRKIRLDNTEQANLTESGREFSLPASSSRFYPEENVEAYLSLLYLPPMQVCANLLRVYGYRVARFQLEQDDHVEDSASGFASGA